MNTDPRRPARPWLRHALWSLPALWIGCAQGAEAEREPAAAAFRSGAVPAHADTPPPSLRLRFRQRPVCVCGDGLRERDIQRALTPDTPAASVPASDQGNEAP